MRLCRFSWPSCIRGEQHRQRIPIQRQAIGVQKGMNTGTDQEDKGMDDEEVDEGTPAKSKATSMTWARRMRGSEPAAKMRRTQEPMSADPRRGSTSEHEPCLQCYYGVLCDVTCAQQLGQLQITPGDGGCFWHCCAHGTLAPGQWHLSLGPKAALVDTIVNEPTKMATIMHASPSVATSLQEACGRWEDWADGRAMPLVAVLREVTLMMVNIADARIEVFSPCALLHRLEQCGPCNLILIMSTTLTSLMWIG